MAILMKYSYIKITNTIKRKEIEKIGKQTTTCK